MCPVAGPSEKAPANNGYKPGFAAAMMIKDLALAAEAVAEALGGPEGLQAQPLHAGHGEDGDAHGRAQADGAAAADGVPVLLGDIASFELIQRPREIQRENRILEAYQDFRGALKQSEVLAFEILNKAEARLPR